MGESFEGREINVLKINVNDKELPAVIIDAGKIWKYLMQLNCPKHQKE